MYKLIDGGGVIDLDKNLIIPENENNRHWKKYQKWLADNNTPEAADPKPNETRERLIKRRMRANARAKAISDLITEGKLPADFTDGGK